MGLRYRRAKLAAAIHELASDPTLAIEKNSTQMTQMETDLRHLR
jgi:hypothetical protein